MNKYQEALDNLITIERERTFKRIGTFSHTNCDVLQELVDQTKAPTLEQVQKEWKALGYRWEELITHIHIIKCDRCITINLMCNEYECHDRTSLGSCCSTSITFQEHQLLTKTFKALGWE